LIISFLGTYCDSKLAAVPNAEQDYKTYAKTTKSGQKDRDTKGQHLSALRDTLVKKDKKMESKNKKEEIKEGIKWLIFLIAYWSTVFIIIEITSYFFPAFWAWIDEFKK
jgi:hypothetical protein